MAGCSQKSTQCDDGFVTTSGRRVKTTPLLQKSTDKVRSSLLTIGELIRSSDSDLKKILVKGKSKVRCFSCNALGSLSPVGKAGATGYRRWKCGARPGEAGCKMTCAQVIVFASAFGAGKPKSWASMLPKELAKRINHLVVRSSEVVVPLAQGNSPQRGAQVGEPIQVSGANPPTTNPKDVLAEIEKELQLEIKSKKGAKLLSLLMQTVRAVLTTDGAPEKRGPAVVQNEPKAANSAPNIKAPMSYAAAAAKKRPVWARPTVKELTRPLGDEEKVKMGLKALQWKPLKPINKRLVRHGQPLREGTLKEKVQTTKFVYVAGMTRQPYGVVRAALSAAGIDKRKIYDISFVGKQVGCLLTTNDYVETVEKVLTRGGSSMKILRDFDPMSNEHLKRPMSDGGVKKAPAELYARRAAFAVSKSNNLLVATKYQENIPSEYFDIFRNELDKLVEARKRVSKPKKSKGKAKRLTNVNEMEVDIEK